MLRLPVCALMMCMLLAACGSVNDTMVRAQLSKPQRDQYPQIVSAFIDQCVKAGAAAEKHAASKLYVIKKSDGACAMTVDTYYDDDTVIADLLTKDLKRADPRFARLPNSMLGTAWRIGKGTKWSATDGTPLVALGRSSSKDPLLIRRFGPSL